MTKSISNRFRAQRVRILSLTPTGRKSGELEYETLDANGEVLNTGVAACFDTNLVEIDDDDCLVGESYLSSSGEFISRMQAFDRSGLGYKK